MEILYLVIGLLIGSVLTWLLVKNRYAKDSGISLETIEKNYIQKSLFDQIQSQSREQDETIIALTRQVAQLQGKETALQDKIDNHQKELQEIREQMHREFELLSNRIFEEKSNKLLELSEKKVADILNPLKERIQEFEKKVQDTYNQETRERASLKKELETIVKLNQQVSEDTIRLANALKGDKKFQGNWGEIQLELILTRAGLEKDIHFRKQESLRDESGNIQRPDYILNLPENKNLVLDSKVSLVAYEQFFNEEDEAIKQNYLKLHIQNLNRHIADLGNKNYQSLYGINPPDYVLMFVPIEPALYLALREENRLFERALEKNIVLVSTSTLLATLRTISYIWKQDNQRKNVVEIAKESGALYDKFVGFMDDLVNLGRKLDGAKSDYSEAMNKLFESKQKGSTIIGRIERIKKLGADTTKSLPQNILDRIDE